MHQALDSAKGFIDCCSLLFNNPKIIWDSPKIVHLGVPENRICHGMPTMATPNYMQNRVSHRSGKPIYQPCLMTKESNTAWLLTIPLGDIPNSSQVMSKKYVSGVRWFWAKTKQTKMNYLIFRGSCIFSRI